jgi:RNA polymerase sigma-70 factor (ECF subfamily)
MSNIMGTAVHEALWQLPAAQREAITLMDLCGLTAAQVATMTGAPRGTVLARVHRGHKRLAELLEEVAPGDA